MHEERPVSVRAASLEEIDSLADLWLMADGFRRNATSKPIAEAGRAGLCRLLRERWFVRDAIFYVAAAERIVGMVHALPARADDGAGAAIAGCMHLSLLAVAPARSGEGIGKALALACVGRAAQLGYRSIQLWTHASNERALALYANVGFVDTGRAKIEAGEAVRLLVHRLESPDALPIAVRAT